MLKFNNKVLHINDKWLNPTVSPEPPGPSFDSVTIGTQTWMTKNLNIDDGQGGVYIVENVEANGLNMGKQYYYTPEAAIRIANSIPGWHLPSKEEFQTLASYVGTNSASKLKSTSGWDNNANGTDDYLFNGEPTGYVINNDLNDNDLTGMTFHDNGLILTCWSSTRERVHPDMSMYAYYALNLTYNSNDIYVSGNILYNCELSSVRLIKDT